MALAAIAAVAAPIVGGIVGNIMSQGDRASAKKAMKQAIAELEAIGYPPDTSKALILQEFEQQGIYSPELEQDLSDSFAESEVAKIEEDPTLRNAQMSALAKLQRQAQTGLTAEDRAALNLVRNEVQRDAQANRASALSNMAARGQGSSGASFLAQLQAGQDAADLASQQSDTLMAQAQQRALQALSESANQAGNIRGQDFNVANTKAQALDERNKFLQQNSIDRQTRNVGQLNQAQLANLQEQQRIADANAQMKNQEAARQAEAARADFQNKLGLAQAKSSAYTGQQNYYQQQAQNTAQSYAGMGSALGTGIGAYNQQQNAKEQQSLLAKILAKKEG